MGAVKLALVRAGTPAPGLLAARLGWEGRRLLRRLGWAGCAGVAALLLAAAATWQGQRLEAHQQVQRQGLAEAHARRQAPPAQAPAGSASRLAAFQSFLPAHETIPDLLKQLAGVAQQHGVTLSRADYKALAGPEAAFMRYQITMPVKADYPRVQGFVIGALTELPSLTLENITFQRERIEAADVEARLHFQLLVRTPVRKGVRR